MKHARACTRIAYQRSGMAEPNAVIDVCHIYPDPDIPDSYVALSLETSKVGVGANLEAAYLNLIVGLAHALRYQSEKQSKAAIGKKVTGERRDLARTASRMGVARQGVLLKVARAMFLGCPPDSIDEDPNKALTVNPQHISEETWPGWDISPIDAAAEEALLI